MDDTASSDAVRRLRYEDKEVILVGTAHVSRESVDLVKAVIEAESPDTVCVELCEGRYQALRRRDQWQDTDIVEVIRKKKVFVLLSNLILASFQKRMAAALDVRPGQEMIQAMESAEEISAEICLADRDIRATLARTWGQMGVVARFKLFFQLILATGSADEITEDEVEQLKQRDVLESILAELGHAMPSVKRTLIGERDQYLAAKIREAPGEKVVAVVGAGHLTGIEEHWHEPVDLDALSALPARSRWARILAWLIPIAIVAVLAYGFLSGGADVGTDMIVWWVAANGLLSAAGAILAMGHPLTVLSAGLASPLTSLNPMMAAGWVAGLVETFVRKPKVRDLENLQTDAMTLKGFRRNGVTRVLLVVVFTNLGSVIGTFVALPMMVRLMNA